MVDEMINQDNTLRFRTKVPKKNQPQIMKLYLKGQPDKCEFYNGKNDPFFKNAASDCLNHKVIEKKLTEPAVLKKLSTKKVTDILFPKCLTVLEGPPPQSDYYNFFNKPVGKSLKDKCIFGANLNVKNSCIDFIADISRAIARGIAILNSGDKWLKHGSIYLPHVYHVLEKDNSSKVFLDNMKFEATKYEDPENMPFKDDFVMLGNVLLKVLLGTDDEAALKRPFISPLDIYTQAKNYFKKNEIELHVKHITFNIPQNFGNPNKKIVMLDDLDYTLRNSFFNFVYRLLYPVKGIIKPFTDVKQGLDHKFIKVLKEEEGKKKQALSEAWNALPSDF